MDENLKKIINELLKNTLTPQQLEGFLTTILKSITTRNSDFDTKSASQIQMIKDALALIETNYADHLENIKITENNLNENIKTTTAKAEAKFNAKIKEANKLIDQIKAIEIHQGVDADEDAVVEKVLASIDIPKYEKSMFEDTGLDIVRKINDLRTDDEMFMIDASHIKNFPQYKGDNPQKIAVGGVRFLSQLADVNLFGLADGDTIVWNAASGTWIPGAAGGSSPLTTKGDIYTYSTTDDRLGVGTDGQVLVADSAEVTGLKWEDANIAFSPTLQEVLASGNITNGYDIAVTNGDTLDFDVGLGVHAIFESNVGSLKLWDGVNPGVTFDVGAGTISVNALYSLNGGYVGTSLVSDGFWAFKNITTTESVSIVSGATSASYTLTLPTAQGGANTFLKNDGTGVLSWAAGSSITPTLTATQIAFGDGSNLMTSSANLVFDNANTQLSIAGNGTAALPAFSVGGTTNGIYLAATNQLGFATNGVNRMNLNSVSLRSVTNGGFLLARAAGSAAAPTYAYQNDDDTGFYSDVANTVKTSFGGTQYSTWNATGLFIGGTTTPTAKLHLAAGSTAASSAPIKLTSGPVTSVTEIGTIEFTTDDLFFTITTGTARKRLLMADPTGGITSGQVLYATTNGRATGSTDMTFGSSTLTVTKLKVGSGSVTLDAIDQAQYNPSATIVANVDSVSVTASNWTRVGRMVHVWGIFSVDPTSANTLTQFTFTLPIASNLSSNYDLVGGATNSVDGETAARIYADTGADEALVEFTPKSTTTSYDWSYWFDYEII